MHVLLVEDESQIADFIARGLSEQGHAVDVASDGRDALYWNEVAEFDVIILDVMLPDIDGVEVCRTLRYKGLSTPILMLTAKDSVEDRVAGLDSGADDYLVKPFAFAELLARLRALRQFKMDTTTLEVSRQGVVIDLTTKECRLLGYLMRHPH